MCHGGPDEHEDPSIRALAHHRCRCPPRGSRSRHPPRPLPWSRPLRVATRRSSRSRSCPGQTRPSYTLAPDGGFEDDGSDWSLEDGAAVVSGNEPYYVRDAGDTRSLKLPAGSSAMSPTMCVGIEHPTLRLFARNTGSPLSSLKVKVHYVDAARRVALRCRSASLGPRPSWQPTQPMVIGVNLLPLLPGEQTPVAFEFTPVGLGRQLADRRRLRRSLSALVGTARRPVESLKRGPGWDSSSR